MSRKVVILSIARAALCAAALLAGVVTESAAGQLSGRVTSSTTSNGLAGTVIRFFNLDVNDFGTTVTADSAGNYTVNLPAGNYAILTDNNQGYINEIWDNIPCSSVCDTNAITPILVGANPITNINFVLDPGSRIGGTITAAGTGLPIANVVVTFIDPNGQVDFTSATTDATGVYLSNGGSAPGNVFASTSNSQGYRNEAYNNIYCLDCNPNQVGTPIVVTLLTNRTDINFALDLGGRISGTVTNMSDTPVAGVSIRFDNSTGSFVDQALTDALGNYSSAGLPGGTYFAVTNNNIGLVDELYNNFLCPGGNCSSTNGTAIPVTVGNTADVDFVLALGGTVTGTVTNASNALPISNANVSLYNSGGTFFTGTSTDNSGVYSFVVPAGNYFATTNNVPGFSNQLYSNMPCPGFCSVTGGTAIPVTAGQTTGTINFALTAGASISGTVNGAGTPLINAQVWLYSNTGGFLSSANTNGSGVYTFSGLSDGSYYVRTNVTSNFINQLHNGVTCISCNVASSGGTPVAVTAPGTTTVNFNLVAGGRISGTVTNSAGGLAIQNVSVQIHNSAGSFLTSFSTDASGNYITQGLPAGVNYYVRTSNSQGFQDKLWNNQPCSPGCTVTTGTAITLTAGNTTPNISFVLTAGGRISGRVTNASGGAGIQNVSAQIYNSSGTFLGSANTDSSGNYTTSGLPAGTYYSRTFNNLGFVEQLYNGIQCPLGGCTVTSGTLITVEVGVTTPNVNYNLTLGGRISGQVLNNATGAGISGFVPVIYNASGVALGGTNADASGNYLTGALLPGNYFVFASPLGFASRLYNNRPCPFTCTITSGTPVAVTAGNTTGSINFRLNPNFFYTDFTLTAQLIRTVHINELRTEVNLVRQQVGLAPFTFTDTPLSAGVSAIKAVHISELRSALNDVYDALAITRPTYTDATLTAGVTIKAAHITDLRNAVEAVR